MRRIAVIGASGLAGAALCEYLLDKGRDEVVPLIRSSGNAWRLARRGLALRTVDCLDAGDVSRAVEGCTHVVNCVRGDDRTMLDGLRNALQAARAAGVKGFVHLSSVAVFGDPPPPEAVTEDGRVGRPPAGTYGAVKFAQDELVRRAARDGLAAVIICPPNIGGPYSYFLDGLQIALAARRLPLVDGGSGPCNLVDTLNLARAIELALDNGSSAARLYFVTDGEVPAWSQVVDELRMAAGIAPQPPQLSRAEAQALVQAAAPAVRVSLRRSLLHLVSSDVRAALRKDPLWARVDGLLRGSVARLGGGFETRLRHSIEGPIRIPRRPAADYAAPLIAQQLRTVRHSSERARRELGYEPLVSFRQSIGAFAACRRGEARLDTEWSDLLSVLRPA
jgi:nucleoside-diphosphate-sugar epimerase